MGIYEELTVRRAELAEALDALKRRSHAPDTESAPYSPSSRRPVPVTLKQLVVACVMDEFTYSCYSPECVLLPLTPEGWRQEIEKNHVDLLFIESAWKGQDGLWYRMIANSSKTLFALCDYCREKNIPIVFWNKEDPVHTKAFLPAARAADYVFTCDISCVEKYKAILGHDRVFYLHFAAQPRLHHPVEQFRRKDMFSFAGGYYHHFPDRKRVFDSFAEYFTRTNGLDIYDRHFGGLLEQYQFPEEYADRIVGRLNVDEIAIAYKGYNYSVNMNTVKDSPTMCSRRLYELLASNTVTVGNYSRGAVNLFGDLTISTDDAAVVEEKLRIFAGDQERMRKYRLLGLRKVLTENLYEDRLAYIADKVFSRELGFSPPSVSIIAVVQNSGELERILRMYSRQTYTHKELIIFGGEAYVPGCRVYPTEEAQTQPLCEISAADYICVFSPEDYYGENYLYDLIYSVRYQAADGIGKLCFYSFDEGNYSLHNSTSAYQAVSSLDARRMIVKTASVNGLTLNALCHEAPKDISFFSADEFNYCANFTGESCPKVDDLVVEDTGLSCRFLTKSAESVAVTDKGDALYVLDEKRIYASIAKSRPDFSLTLADNKIHITSSLPGNQFDYLYLSEELSIAEHLDGGDLTVRFALSSNHDVRPVIIYLDADKNRLSHEFFGAGVPTRCAPPESAKMMRLGYRFMGPGDTFLLDISFGCYIPSGENFYFQKSNTLLITPHYPSYENIYRFMFVHSRVRLYQSRAKAVDVFRCNRDTAATCREYNGVEIAEGSDLHLGDILKKSRYKSVLIHFLDEYIWRAIGDLPEDTPVTVWIHGAEIQPWQRREFNITDERHKAEMIEASDRRVSFWREVFEVALSGERKLHFVFVSQYFADEVMGDYQISLPKSLYSVIHNVVDTNLFDYRLKPSSQRFKILSIRPYQSRMYANDLTIKAILELAKNKKLFKKLSFMIIGDGKYFDEITKPLRGFGNVALVNKFISRAEISALHKDYGIFLVPTRWDSQGVSRDEAMASGLVPVTNEVAAIPEFADDNSAVLAPAEDYKELAKGIARLANDPALFETMSRNAAERVRGQSSEELTVGREVGFIV